MKRTRQDVSNVNAMSNFLLLSIVETNVKFCAGESKDICKFFTIVLKFQTEILCLGHILNKDLKRSFSVDKKIQVQILT